MLLPCLAKQTSDLPYAILNTQYVVFESMDFLDAVQPVIYTMHWCQLEISKIQVS